MDYCTSRKPERVHTALNDGFTWTRPGVVSSLDTKSKRSVAQTSVSANKTATPLFPLFLCCGTVLHGEIDWQQDCATIIRRKPGINGFLEAILNQPWP
jgi:hypothetical protein